MIAGNYEDKYNSKNPISKLLVESFTNTFKSFLTKIKSPKKIVEIGAGEGYLTRILAENFPDSQIYASDISSSVLKIAKETLKNYKVSLSTQNVEKLEYKSGEFDLVVCCEVLEHVESPKNALREIRRIAKNRVLLSVPREPLWRVLNVVRLKYLKELGNTPGHLNHWGVEQFLKLVESSGFRIISKQLPLPWQMVLAKKI